MIFWILLGAMLVMAAAGLARPLLRRETARVPEREAVLAVLEDQLAEIDGQAAAGALTPDEADALRVEVRRRLLAEARVPEAPSRALSPRARTAVAAGFAAALALGATGIYAAIGRPDLATRAPDPGRAQAQAAVAEVQRLIPQIETRLGRTPDDPEGWRLLGWALFQVGRYPEAANAYRRATELAPALPGNHSAMGEALVQAAGGSVTPDAAVAFEAARRLDPSDARARYFLGVLKAQRGDARGALADWTALLNEAPPDAPWAAEVRAVVERVSQEAGIDAGARPAAGGPTPDQVRAMAAMSPDERSATIRGMVDGLAGRLAADPRDADGWVRLMRARMVLGQPDAAEQALRDALGAFADAPAEQAAIRQAARAAGVPGA